MLLIRFNHCMLSLPHLITKFSMILNTFFFCKFNLHFYSFIMVSNAKEQSLNITKKTNKSHINENTDDRIKMYVRKIGILLHLHQHYDLKSLYT